MSAAVDIFTELPNAEIAAFKARHDWLTKARSPLRMGKQIPPADLEWEILLFLAGRGFGKTAGQVQWAWNEGWNYPNLIIHAVAPTLSDVNGTTFEGDAGFLKTVPYECLLGGSVERAYNKSRHELRLSNGTLIRGFGAVEEAGRLRGPQCHALIADELREWDRPAGNLRDAMNNALFGLRLRYPDGSPSRAVMGTTPKPIPFLKQFMKRPGVRVVRGTSRENLANLSVSFRSQIMALAGTALGRQEIDADFIDEENDLSILKRNWIRLWPVDQKTGRHKPIPQMSYIVASYDTASSEENIHLDKQETEQKTDPTACIVLGIFNTHEAFTEEERKKYGMPSRYAALLLDAWSGRYGLPALLDRARAYNQKKFGPADHSRKVDMTLIEDKSSGPGVRQFMRLWGLTVYPCKPRVSKAMRVHNISPLIFQGMLWVPESPNPARKGLPIAWADEFMDQVCAFAGEGSVEHDDFVDCLSQAFNYLRERGTLEAVPQVAFLDREEKIEFERRQAEKQYQAEKRSNRAAPYG